MDRTACVNRKTKETDISVLINLDGSGKSHVDTGIGFFDHMLENFARHGLIDLELTCTGDLNVDSHHTVEDCGIVLGTAIREAVKDKVGIERYGSFVLPMDETLVLCALDLCGRPYMVFDASFKGERCGQMDTQMFCEFFYAVSYSAGMNLHIKEFYGTNDHHVAEAMFKAFARALRQAVTVNSRINGVISTKGII